MSTSCKRNKLFINSVLPIGGEVESDQKNNVTGEYFFFTMWSDNEQEKTDLAITLQNFVGISSNAPLF